MAPNADESISGSWRVSTCHNHPDTAAARRCPNCNAYYCTACLKMHRVGNQVVEFCLVCGSKCERVVDAPDQPERSQGFYGCLPSVFMSPFRGNGPIILIAGTIFFSLASLTAFLPFVGFFLFFIGAGYLAAFFLNVITTTARGDESLPTWPDLTDIWNDIVRPFLLVLGAGTLCFGPAIGYRLFSGIHENMPSWPYWFLLSGGGLYFPMALLGVALFDGLHGANPLVGISSILKVPGAYAVTCVVFALLYGAGEFAAWISNSIPLAGAVLGGFLSLYFAVVQMRLLGTLYYEHRDQLNWF